MALTPDATTYDEHLVDDPAGPQRWTDRVASAGRMSLSRVIVLLLVVLFLVVYFWKSIFISIESGQAGVLYVRFGGGTQTDRVLGEGMKVIAPWDRLYIYDTRIQEVKHTMDVLTSEGLPVKLDLSIRYHPEYDLVGLLHQRVGPEYPAKVVVPEVESALRLTMGNFPMRDVYGSQRGLVQQALNEGLEQVEQKFVRIDDVVIREVTLPEGVRQTIEQKMQQRELSESYAFRLEVATKEAARLLIEANGLKAYNDTLNTSLTPSVLRWEGINATKELAKSPNAKTVVVGSQGSGGLPLILGNQ